MKEFFEPDQTHRSLIGDQAAGRFGQKREKRFGQSPNEFNFSQIKLFLASSTHTEKRQIRYNKQETKDLKNTRNKSSQCFFNLNGQDVFFQKTRPKMVDLKNSRLLRGKGAK